VAVVTPRKTGDSRQKGRPKSVADDNAFTAADLGMVTAVKSVLVPK